MFDPLEIDLPPATRRILQFIADVGMIGETPAEVARHLIFCGLQEMVRHGELQLGEKAAELPAE